MCEENDVQFGHCHRDRYETVTARHWTFSDHICTLTFTANSLTLLYLFLRDFSFLHPIDLFMLFIGICFWFCYNLNTKKAKTRAGHAIKITHPSSLYTLPHTTCLNTHIHTHKFCEDRVEPICIVIGKNRAIEDAEEKVMSDIWMYLRA
jgi:hypothetical protein